MNDKLYDEFQAAVDDCLLRHRSILDVITKYQEASARVNRAFAKAVTECGCITVTANRQQTPADVPYSQLKQYMSSHTSGQPCEHCREVLAKEIGHTLFYLAALCNVSGLSFNETMENELNTIATLGAFHLS